eukprot:TRINITY_DN54107_c0_g1_i1.p1 TRINITY_DN54107_c0_g1~~TRINITY_DN54107_c0_g1_i1.p1  ORF type:complete len:391 (-),score=89.03 TRINITY_DN54107_c0_g1_i1:73-1245(-)
MDQWRKLGPADREKSINMEAKCSHHCFHTTPEEEEGSIGSDARRRVQPQDVFLEFDGMLEAIRATGMKLVTDPPNPKYSIVAADEFKREQWKHCLQSVVWPAIDRVRVTGAFQTICFEDFSSMSDSNWNAFYKGAELWFSNLPRRLMITNTELNDGYQKIYSMSTRRDSGILDWMYESYLEGLRRYLRRYVLPGLLLGNCAPLLTGMTWGDQCLLEQCARKFVVEWIRFKMICATLNSVFKYLDRYYVSNNLKSSLIGSSYPLFRCIITEPHRHHLRTLLFRLVKFRSDSKVVEFFLQALEEIDHKSTNSFTRGLSFDQDVQFVNQLLIQDNLMDHNINEPRDLWKIVGEYVGNTTNFTEVHQEVIVLRKKRARAEEADNNNDVIITYEG